MLWIAETRFGVYWDTAQGQPTHSTSLPFSTETPKCGSRLVSHENQYPLNTIHDFRLLPDLLTALDVIDVQISRSPSNLCCWSDAIHAILFEDN
jgi:hypothetical protein